MPLSSLKNTEPVLDRWTRSQPDVRSFKSSVRAHETRPSPNEQHHAPASKRGRA